MDAVAAFHQGDARLGTPGEPHAVRAAFPQHRGVEAGAQLAAEDRVAGTSPSRRWSRLRLRPGQHTKADDRKTATIIRADMDLSLKSFECGSPLGLRAAMPSHANTTAGDVPVGEQVNAVRTLDRPLGAGYGARIPHGEPYDLFHHALLGFIDARPDRGAGQRRRGQAGSQQGRHPLRSPSPPGARRLSAGSGQPGLFRW